MDQREYIFLVLYQTFFFVAPVFTFFYLSHILFVVLKTRNHVLPLSFHFDVGCLRVR
jgi:hypothetical protein